MPRTTTYADQLKDPRWQRKRLEIMQREHFTCEQCGTHTETLHIHHGYYERGLAPWEYPDETLHCLCEGCHETTQGLLLEAQRALGLLVEDWDFAQAIGFLHGLAALWAACSYETPLPEIRVPDHLVGFLSGLGHAFNLTDDEVIQLKQEGLLVDAEGLANVPLLLQRWRQKCVPAPFSHREG